MKHTQPWLPLVFILSCFLLTACGQPQTAAAKPKPVKVETIKGTDLHRVEITQRAAERINLQTIAVREEAVTRKRRVGGEVVTVQNEIRVKVPMTDGDLKAVDQRQPAQVFILDSNPKAAGIPARPSTAVGGATTTKDSAVSLFYAFEGARPDLKAGQRVFVELALAGNGTPRKLIPYSAVVYDLKGETWTYTNPEPLVFVRQRVQVDYIDGETAVLTEGPAAGVKIVTVGVAELYGAESGVGGSGH